MNHRRSISSHDVRNRESHTLLENAKRKSKVLEKSPQYSAVLENNNLYDTHEISWLQKYADQNQKLTDSRFFQENYQQKQRENVNEMKFSFNDLMNPNVLHQKKNAISMPTPEVKYAKQYKYDLEQNLKQIKQDHAKKGVQADKPSNRLKQSNAGAIKKNRLQQERDKKYNFNDKKEPDDLAKMKDWEKRLDQVIKQDRQRPKSINSTTVTLKQNVKPTFDLVQKNQRKRYSEFSNERQLQGNARDHPLLSKNTPTLSKGNSSSISSKLLEGEQSLNPPNFSHFWPIFTYFDESRLGHLSKHNCRLENVREQLKLIIGGVISRIKLKGESMKFQTFKIACDLAIKEFEWNDIKDFCINFKQREQKESKICKQKQSRFETLQTFSKPSISKTLEPSQSSSSFVRRKAGSICSISSQISKNAYIQSNSSPESRQSPKKQKPAPNFEKRKRQGQGLVHLDRLSSRIQNYLKKNSLGNNISESTEIASKKSHQLSFNELVKHI